MTCVKSAFNLNLTNFESSSAANCQYILTSPRSLKACRKAGIKPVELLFRSLSDFEDELGISSGQVYEFYKQHERDRQCKIEICKSIRNKLLTDEDKKHNIQNYNENNQFLYKPITRKDQLDRENLLKASTLNGNTKDSPVPVTSSRLSNLNSSSSESPILGNSGAENSYKNVLCEGSRRSVVFDSSSSASSLSTGTPGIYVNNLTVPGKLKLGRKSTPKSSSLKKKSKTKFNSPMRSSWDQSKGDKFEINSSQLLKKNKNHNCERNALHTKNTNNQLILLKSESISSSSKCNSYKKTKAVKNNNYGKLKENNNKSEYQIKKPIKSSNKENNLNINKVLKKGYDCGNTYSNKYDFDNRKPIMKRSLQNLCYSRLRNQTSLCASSLSLGIPQPKRKHRLYDFMNIDNLSIPENDRRILETLALKKEQERESEEFAHQAHQLWERRQQERIMAENEQKLKWQKYVQEKRKTESMQNLIRMEEVKQSLRESQISLEERLNRRDKRVAELKKQNEEKKLTEIIERRDLADKRKAIVEANCKQKQIEVELVQQKHQEELQQRLERAEYTRSRTKQSIHRRVASANRMEELRHQENMLEVLADQDMTRQQKKREIRERQSRARERYSEQMKHRERHIKESSAEQKLRAMQVKEIHRDLDQGLEQWQDQVMLLQWADSQRAEASVQTQIENRRLRLEIENKERQLLHIQRMQKVKQAENSRKQNIRETIQAKEKRINILQQRREKEIQEGRIQAQTTADLREHLRRTLSPETFDRKVARAAIEMRIGSRPVTASPTMMRSHIYLG